MKSSVGKLSFVVLIVLLGIILFMPMRVGFEDSLTIPVEGIVLDAGGSYTLKYTLVSETAQTVRYTSDDELIASVNQYGQIRAMSPGRTTIRLEAQKGAKTSAFVEVRGNAVTQIALNTESVTMLKGDVSGLTCTVNEDADDTHVEWRSADPDIVIVDSEGRIKALSGGTTYVMATASNGLSAAAKVTVEVNATSLRLTPESITVGVGAVFGMESYFLPEDSTNVVSAWESDAPDVVAVDENGRMQAISAGTAVITATASSGVQGTAIVTVEPAAGLFYIDPSEITVERGETYALTSHLTSDDTTGSVDHLVMWESSDESVAVVYEGLFHAYKTGTAVITASADGMLSECVVHVKTSVKDVSLPIYEKYMLKEDTRVTYKLDPVVTPADADDTSLTYLSDNELVAKVDAEGYVYFTGGYGTVNITVRTVDGPEAVFTIHVVTALPADQVQ